MKFGAIVIAAGLSSRMKDFKPLLPLKDRPAIFHCLDLFNHPQIEQRVVVTGYRSDELTKALRHQAVSIVHNPQYREGMFSSICCGMAALESCDGVFLLPVDIPLVRPSTVNTLIENFTGDCTLFPHFTGTPGHPPLIPMQYRKEILSYDGEGGLQKFLLGKAHKQIEVWDEASLIDMDSPQDYEHLQGVAEIQGRGTRAEVEAIADTFMPRKGVEHGVKTAQVALRLARALPQTYDLDLIYHAALLHDISKGQKQHEAAGAQLVGELGLAQLSPIIASHKSLPSPVDDIFSASDIVCLADKIVRGCRMVTIEERFEEKLVLYQGNKMATQAITRRYKNALASKEAYERASKHNLYDLCERN